MRDYDPEERPTSRLPMSIPTTPPSEKIELNRETALEIIFVALLIILLIAILS